MIPRLAALSAFFGALVLHGLAGPMVPGVRDTITLVMLLLVFFCGLGRPQTGAGGPRWIVFAVSVAAVLLLPQTAVRGVAAAGPALSGTRRGFTPFEPRDYVEGFPSIWRRAFVAHYYRELGDTPTCVGLRTETEKLVLYAGHPEWTEVFNLMDDPYETENLASDKKLLARLQEELKEQMRAIELPMPR